MSAHGMGADFQRSMLRLALENEAFAFLISQYLKVSFFETPALGWIFNCIAHYVTAYGRPPSALVLRDMVGQLDPSYHASYAPTVEAVVAAPAVEEAYIATRIEEFVRRNLIVEGVEKLRNLYNTNNLEELQAFFVRRAEEVASVSLKKVDRTFFFEDVNLRAERRQRVAMQTHLYTFSTGIKELDDVLDGGLSRGELGLWSAVAKAGKSHFLQWFAYFAVRALRIPVLYIILEGGREQTEDRFEAAFAYRTAKELRADAYSVVREQQLIAEYNELRRLLVIRGFTKSDEGWNTTVNDIWTEIRALRQREGFKPLMIVIDYLDLLRDGEKRSHDNEMREQAAVVRQVKKLADRDDGYAIWTASQIQRQKPAKEQNPDWVPRSGDIADSIEKIRAVDFHGTIARTDVEKRAEKARIFAELYRSAPAGKLIEINTDFAHHRAYTSVSRATEIEVLLEQQHLVGDDW